MATLQPLVTKPESLTQMVYDAIRLAIVSKEIAPGTPVSEAQLARDLQVSKTPVRETLLRLQTVGLVEPDGARGLRVITPSLDRIADAYDIRGMLEAGAARLAAERASAEEKEDILQKANESLSAAQSGDSTGFARLDAEFHLEIAAAAKNPRLLTLVEDALSLTRVLRQRDVPAKTDATRCGDQHVGIAQLIIAGDPAGAARHAAQHAEDVQRIVLGLADFADGDPAAGIA